MTFLQFWLIGTVITTTCLFLVSLASTDSNSNWSDWSKINDWSTIGDKIEDFFFFLFLAVFSFLLWPIVIGVMLADQYVDQYRVMDRMKEKMKE